MKNKMKGLIVLVIFTLSLGLSTVNADDTLQVTVTRPNTATESGCNAVGGAWKYNPDKGKMSCDTVDWNNQIKFTGVDSNGEYVEESYAELGGIKVTVNGQEVDGFCLDKGSHAPGTGATYTCEQVTNKALAYVLSSGANETIKTTAARLLSGGGNMTISGGNSAQVYDLINQANAYAGSTAGTGGQLNFIRTGGNGPTVTYQVTSPTPIKSGVTFTCGAGCSVSGSIAPGGTTGTITVTVIDGQCKFTVNAVYDGIITNSTTQINGDTANKAFNSTVFHCYAEGKQEITYTLNSNTTGGNNITGGNNTTGETETVYGKVTQSFSDTIKKELGGDYYKTYCEGPEEPNKCTCTQNTMVKAPNYCDSARGQTMTVKVTDKETKTEETDVKCCILNGTDEAGNSYQMVTDEIDADNPYCAVFCVEEYEMSMPGSRFVDSGRFFELEDTKVTAKRTCYATNKDQDVDAPQIKIDDFVTEVSKLQEDMIKAFNNYNRWVNEKASALDLATDTKTSTGTCIDGKKDDVETKVGKVKYYKEFTIKHADDWEVTGRWVIDQAIDKKAEFKDEENKYCSPTAGLVVKPATSGTNGTEQPWVCNEDKTDCHHDEEAEPVLCGMDCIERKIAEYEKLLRTYQDRYQKITKWISQCYNWSNTLCLDPIVEFNYDEMYNMQVKYVRKDDGTTTFTSKDAKVSTNKDLLKDNNTYKIEESAKDLKDVNYLFCDDSSCSNDKTQSIVKKLVSDKRIYYRSIEANGTAMYGNTTQFSTQIPHGTIVEGDKENYNQNYYYLGVVFPIALKTERGVYNWTLAFSNIGQYNSESNCSLGRLNQAAAAVQGANQSLAAAIGFVCIYVVDCPDCPNSCSCEGHQNCYEKIVNGEKICYYEEDEKCKDCDVYCVNCVFDGKDTYFYRQISVNEFNPSDRILGANWDATEKGQATQIEIEQLGETIYESAQYSYTLTPANMQKIRKYNQETRTYVAEDLVYDTTTDKVAGKSGFLNDGEEKGYFTENARNTEWQLWEGSTTSNVGPAWK